MGILIHGVAALNAWRWKATYLALGLGRLISLHLSDYSPLSYLRAMLVTYAYSNFTMNSKVLSTLANQEIAGCVSNTSRVLGTGEVAEVARLVLGLPDLLVNKWRPYVAAGTLEVEGVFCHASPQAKWINPFSKKIPPEEKHPELCDLIIVVESTGSGSSPAGKRAALIQAKLGTNKSMKISGHGPSVQRFMYANWPAFDLAGKPMGKLINVQIRPTPNGTCQGTRYACVDVGNQRWDVEASQASEVVSHSSFGQYSGTFKASDTLGDFLVAMLGGASGANCTGNWEGLVKHLQNLAIVRLLTGQSLAGVKAAASTSALSHAARAIAYVSHVPPLVPNSPWREWYVPTGLMNRSTRSTFSRGETFSPTQGFGILTIRVKGIEFIE